MHRGPLLLVATVALLLALATSVGASNATLRTTLNSWSKKVGGDAHSIALAAQQRHPRQMTSSANGFHKDALLARAAVAARKPSTAKGRQGQRLALTAFADYALAGSNWAACGRARLAHQRAASIAYAKAGANVANTANTLLVAAGKLLR